MRRLATLAVVLTFLAVTGRAMAQQAISLDDIRNKAAIAADDRAAIRAWLSQKVAGLLTATDADRKTMVSARESIVFEGRSQTGRSPAFLQAFGEEAVAVLSEADRRAVSPDARLNLVMTFAQLQRVEAVPFLSNALVKEPYAATRYWAAKGMALVADGVAEKSLPRVESDMAEAAEKAFDTEIPAVEAMSLLEMLGKFDHEKAHDVLADAMIKFVQHNSPADPVAAQVMDLALFPNGSLIKAYNRETRADAKSHILMALATACVWVSPPTALTNLMPDINTSLESITGAKVGFLPSDDPTMQKLALMEWVEKLYRDKMIPKRPALPQAVEDVVKEQKEGGAAAPPAPVPVPAPAPTATAAPAPTGS